MKNKTLIGSVQKIENPIVCPALEEVGSAVRILNDQQTAIYQILYVNGLAVPGGRGLFRIERDLSPIGATVVLKITPNNSEFASMMFRESSPKEVLRKCKLIVKEINRKKKRVIDRLACCSLAKRRQCVCVASYNCPVHGSQCHGSHD